MNPSTNIVLIGERAELLRPFLTEYFGDTFGFVGIPNPQNKQGVARSIDAIVAALGRAQRENPSAAYVWIVGDLCTQDTANDAAEVFECLNASLAVQDFGRRCVISNLFFVPSPSEESPVSLDAWAEESRCDCLTWLLPSSHAGVGQSEIVEMAARFLWLATTTRFEPTLRSNDAYAAWRHKLATFGLSGVVAAIGAQRRAKSARLASQLRGVFGESDAATSAIDDSLAAALLPIQSQARTLKTALLSEAPTDPLQASCETELKQVSPGRLAERIWSIFFFFALGRSSSLTGSVEEVARRAQASLEKDIADLVNRSVCDHASPHVTIALLDRLQRVFDEGLSQQAVTSPPGNTLGTALKEVNATYAATPISAGPVLLWWGVPAFLGAYLALPWLGRITELSAYPQWMQFFILFVPLAAVLLSIGSTYRWLWGKRLSHRCELAIQKLLDTFRRTQELAAQEQATRILENCSALVQSWRDAVRSYLCILQDGIARSSVLPQAGNGHAFYVLKDIALRSNDIVVSPGLVADHLVRHGLHHGWQSATADSVTTHVQEALGALYEPTQTLEEALSAVSGYEGTDLGNKLVNLARSLAAIPENTPARSFLFVDNAPTSKLCGWLDLDRTIRSTDQMSTSDRHGVFLLSVFVGLSPETFSVVAQGAAK